MKKWSSKGIGMSCVPFRSCNSQVEYVDKRHQSLAAVPEDTFRYTRTLEELLLDANHIRDLPKQLTNLTRLRKLCLSDNEIRELPQNLGNLTNLAELDVSRNEIHTIPVSIRSLTRLRHLDLSSNAITSLPNSFCELKSLTVLTLNDTALTELPDGFGNLTSLISIELRENALRSLPPSFENLKNLEKLDLGDNELTDLPPFIGQLTKLTELWLDHNLLFRLPKEIGHLRDLVCLDVSENQLDELPDEIGYLKNLTDFLASQNNLDRLPPSIGQLNNLAVLKLEQNKLSKIHPGLQYCCKLQELFLRENLLEEISDWVGSLVQLRILNMDCNRITAVSEKIENLKQLGVLSLRMNLIERLPDEIGSCVKLMVIDVSGNKLQNLPFTITSLQLLKAVWLSENQSQPMPHFSTDYVLSEPVLTCYLLPQQPMDTTYPQDAKLSIDDSADMMEITRTSTVKFQDGGSDEDSVNGVEESTGFVRHNTPHPKDLKAKFQRWFGGGSKPKSKNIDKVFVAPDENENSKGPFRPLRHSYDVKEPYHHSPVQTKELVREMEEVEKKATSSSEAAAAAEAEADNEDEDVEEETEVSDNQVTLEERHVGFDVESDTEEDQTDDQERHTMRLQRRDTPHHLKNKRIVQESADSAAIRALLEKNRPSAVEPLNYNPGSNKQSKEDLVDGNPPKDAVQVLMLTLNRESGCPFGLNIAGGLGSSPFVDNDQSIFISKVVPGGLAEVAGLKAGDRVLNVNGIDFTNIEHMAAVDAIRKAGNKIIFQVERKLPKTIQISTNSDPPLRSPGSLGGGLLLGIGSKPENKGVGDFDSLIPSEVRNPHAVVTVTVKHPDIVSKPIPELFPPAPTDLGTVTETITKSTLTETVFTRVTHNEALMIPVQTEDILIQKLKSESLGVKIVSGTPEECYPFGAPGSGGVYVVYVTKGGPAARAGLCIGHRILEINGKMVDPTDKNKMARALLEAGDKINLRVRKHPPPVGFMEVHLSRTEGEPLGMHIKGGTDNPGNPLDKDDTGIFISKILPTGAVHRNPLLQVGMRILSVNGNPLLNIIHNDAVNVLRGAGSYIEMIVSNGYDPDEVEKLREEGKLPDKIIEILSNKEEAEAAASGSSPLPPRDIPVAEQDRVLKVDDTKASVDRVMEVVKAAEQLANVPPSPKDSRVRHSSNSSSTGIPRSPTGFDVKKTTIVMSGHSHSLTSPGLGGQKKFPDTDNKSSHSKSDDEPLHEDDDKNERFSPAPPTYVNLRDLHTDNLLDLEFTDKDTTRNGGVGMEVRNPVFNYQSSGSSVLNHSSFHRPPLPANPPNLSSRHKFIPTQLNLKGSDKEKEKEESSSVTSPPPIPTPRTSISGSTTGRTSPTAYEELPKEDPEIKVHEVPPASAALKVSPILPPKVLSSSGAGQQPASESEGDETPAFQFSPEFHRVPSPLVYPEHAYIHKPQLGDSKPVPPTKPPLALVIPPVETVVQSTEHEVTLATPAPTTVTGALAASPKEVHRMQPKIIDPASAKSNTVSARAKFFEMEIAQLQQPVQKQPKQFSFLSQYEVDSMRQEEDKKIEAAMGPITVMKEQSRPQMPPPPAPTDLEKVAEEEEFSVDDTPDDDGGDENSTDDEKEKPATYEIIHARAPSPIIPDVTCQVVNLRDQSQGQRLTLPDVNVSVSVNVNTPNRASSIPQARSGSTSSLSSLSSIGSVRTAKAEKRLREKLSKEQGVRFAEGTVGGQELSPSEQRALQAEKRAAWRQARLKSLEQDALQAQQVLNRMSEIIDTPTNANTSSFSDQLDNFSVAEADEDNNLGSKSQSLKSLLSSPSTSPSSKLQGSKIPIPVMVRANSSPAMTVRPKTAGAKSQPFAYHTVEFPSLYIRQKSAGPRKIIGERERVVGEKVSRKTEEWFNEETGTVEIRTIEIVEKIIEHEVETSEQKIMSIELETPQRHQRQDSETSSTSATSPSTPTSTTAPGAATGGPATQGGGGGRKNKKKRNQKKK